MKVYEWKKTDSLLRLHFDEETKGMTLFIDSKEHKNAEKLIQYMNGKYYFVLDQIKGTFGDRNVVVEIPQYLCTKLGIATSI